MFAFQKKGKNSMRIISLNLRYAHSLDMNNQGVREPRIVSFISEYSPDFLGVQECEPFWRKRLLETLVPLGYLPAHDETFDANGKYGFKNFIWYNGERNELIESGKIWLSETPDVPSKGFGSRFYISAGYAVLKNKASGETFVYFNTHLDVYDVETRKREVAVLISKIKSFEDKGYKVFVTGDFNDVPESDIYKLMADNFLDARISAKTTTNLGTFNGYRTEGQTIDIASYECIDYCFYTKDVGIDIERFDVVDNWNGGYMSDHNAVIIDTYSSETTSMREYVCGFLKE